MSVLRNAGSCGYKILFHSRLLSCNNAPILNGINSLNKQASFPSVKAINANGPHSALCASFSTLSLKSMLPKLNNPSGLCSAVTPLLPSLNLTFPVSPVLIQQNRTVTKWSLRKGKRKCVKAVPARFFRLSWGAWIRPIVGRNKKRWVKPAKRLNRAKQHVFCNATQSTMLDKMVTKFWRKRRFYVDDIYEPYHQREEFARTAVKPH